MFELEKSLLTENVIKYIVCKIDAFHKVFANTKLQSFQWEDVLAQALIYEHGKHHVEYNGITANSGYDLICNGIEISCKSGSEKNKRINGEMVPCLSISSYRLKTQKTWEDKVNFMKEKHEDSFFCLSSSFVPYFDNIRAVYNLFVFPHELVNMETVIWKEHQMLHWLQPRGLSESQIYYTVEQTSGEQLWLHVPIDKIWKVFSYETGNIESNQSDILPKENGSFLCFNL